MCDKCQKCNCGSKQPVAPDLNVTKVVTIESPGPTGPAGPEGVVPTPVFSNDWFDA